MREVEAEGGDLVAVDDELGLRPVVFYADDWREGEFAAGHGLELELLDKCKNALGIGGGRHNDLDGKVAATGQSGWHYGKGTHAGDSAKACLHLVLYVKNSPVALRPAFESHAGKASECLGDLECVGGLGKTLENLVHLDGVYGHLVDGGIGRRVEDSKNNALILIRGEFIWRLGVEKHGHKREDDPGGVDGRTRAECGIEDAGVEGADFVKDGVDVARQPGILGTRREQLGRHHRRESDGDNAGDQHSAGERECKLAEEGAGETALQADGSVDGGQGERHGHNRPEEFPCTEDGGIKRRLPLAHVALDIFHHDDGVIDYDSHTEDDGQEGEQIDGEAKNLHEKNRSDEGNRYGHNRHQNGAQGTQEKKNDNHDDEQGFAERFHNLLDCVFDINGAVVGDASLEAGGKVFFDLLHLAADAFHDIQRVGIWQWPDAHEHGRLAAEAHLGVVVFRAEDDIGDVLQSNELVALLAHHEPAEFLDRAEVCIRREIDLNPGAFGLPDSREVVVCGEGGADIRGTHAQ